MNTGETSGKRKAAAAAVICFIAAIAITGTYTFKNYKDTKSQNEVAMAEETKELSEKYTVKDEALADEAVDGEIVETEGIGSEENESEDHKSEEGDVSEGEDEESTEEELPASVSNASNVNFTENSQLLWPVAGALLMDYSMDKTVYFKTLDQYKYNPALVIAAAENEPIIAGAPGIVKSIQESAQTGMTLTLDLGSGYEAVYGQLQKVAVNTGDYVDAAITLGYVAEPTKYYSLEGTNVYFEMRKDGQPVDPKNYLQEYVE